MGNASDGIKINRALAVVLAAQLIVTATAAAEPLQCTFIAGADQLAELSGRCRAGDVLLGVVEERLGSPLGYAARICDFRQQIVTYRHPDPSRGQNVFACVFSGRVLELAPG